MHATIPKLIQDRLHLNPGDRIEFILDGDDRLRTTLVTSSAAQLRGMVPTPIPRWPQGNARTHCHKALTSHKGRLTMHLPKAPASIG